MSARQGSLFENQVPRAEPRPSLELPGAQLELWPDFLPRLEADRALRALTREIDFKQDEILVFGQRHKVPRLHRWFGPPGQDYTWSGLTMRGGPWPPVLRTLHDQIAEHLGQPFNSVLVNLYRDGEDAVGWHADDEVELGPAPRIASLSLGAMRDFQFRRKNKGGPGKHGPVELTLALPHGSLLDMRPPTQANWQHCVPRRKRVDAPRVNLTFRG